MDTTHKEACEVLEEFIKTFSQIVKQDYKDEIQGVKKTDIPTVLIRQNKGKF